MLITQALAQNSLLTTICRPSLVITDIVATKQVDNEINSGFRQACSETHVFTVLCSLLTISARPVSWPDIALDDNPLPAAGN